VVPAPLSRPWPARDADHLLVSGATMAALEEELFASGLPVEALMEKAALAVSRRLQALAASGGPGTLAAAARQAREGAGLLVLVGPGHNGGDGLVVARELHLAGWPVQLWCPFKRLKPLTAQHLRHARWLGIPLLEQAPAGHVAALWLDALFGIGQSRALGEALETALTERQQQRPGALVAVDGPSGLCFDSGRLLGNTAACAALSCCIGLLKQGLVQDGALPWVGQLERIDLALPQPLLAHLPASQPLALGEGDQATAPWPALNPQAGKYGRGRVLVVAGSGAYPGAAHLALAGASAAGCGSLRAVVPAAVATGLWQVLPHVVLAASSGSRACADLSVLEPKHLERLDGVLLGPGLGEAEAEACVDEGTWELLQAFAGLLVLDADGLNRLAARQGSAVAPWLQGREGPTWLTPHGGEFARLFPDLAGAAGDSVDGSLLAAAALDHALAGRGAERSQGPGGASPLAVAQALRKQFHQD